MATNKNTDITPALSKDVSFTEKVEAVDTALRSRAAAQREIKTKWAKVVSCLKKYDCKVPVRRPTADTVYNIAECVIYKPQDPRLSDDQLVKAAQQSAYQVRQMRVIPEFMKLSEKKFKGLGEWFDELNEIQALSTQPKQIDEAATKKAQTELQTHIDAYVTAIEAYDETVESVANVKEYIAVVKDVAEISAIAQGSQKALQ